MKKYDKEGNVSYTLGTTLTLELLVNKCELVRRIYVHSKQLDNQIFRKILQLCQTNHIEVVYSDKAIRQFAEKENCYIVGEFQKFSTPFQYHQPTVVLVNPANYGNLGTIIRTTVGFGIHNLAIIRLAADIFHPKTIRASMGAIFHLNFKYFTNFQDYTMQTSNAIYPFMLKSSVKLQDLNVQAPYSLVFGNEGAGLGNEFLSVGTPVRIEHSSKIDSLNLDNAVSIALYKFTEGDF